MEERVLGVKKFAPAPPIGGGFLGGKFSPPNRRGPRGGENGWGRNVTDDKKGEKTDPRQANRGGEGEVRGGAQKGAE